jgi:hypothetical protein
MDACLQTFQHRPIHRIKIIVSPQKLFAWATSSGDVKHRSVVERTRENLDPITRHTQHTRTYTHTGPMINSETNGRPIVERGRQDIKQSLCGHARPMHFLAS